MKRLIVIGARATGSSVALVRAALARQVAVTVITAPGHRLDGAFPDGVERSTSPPTPRNWPPGCAPASRTNSTRCA